MTNQRVATLDPIAIPSFTAGVDSSVTYMATEGSTTASKTISTASAYPFGGIVYDQAGANSLTFTSTLQSSAIDTGLAVDDGCVVQALGSAVTTDDAVHYATTKNTGAGTSSITATVIPDIYQSVDSNTRDGANFYCNTYQVRVSDGAQISRNFGFWLTTDKTICRANAMLLSRVYGDSTACADMAAATNALPTSRFIRGYAQLYASAVAESGAITAANSSVAIADFYHGHASTNSPHGLAVETVLANYGFAPNQRCTAAGVLHLNQGECANVAQNTVVAPLGTATTVSNLGIGTARVRVAAKRFVNWSATTSGAVALTPQQIVDRQQFWVMGTGNCGHNAQSNTCVNYLTADAQQYFILRNIQNWFTTGAGILVNVATVQLNNSGETRITDLDAAASEGIEAIPHAIDRVILSTVGVACGYAWEFCVTAPHTPGINGTSAAAPIASAALALLVQQMAPAMAR